MRYTGLKRGKKKVFEHWGNYYVLESSHKKKELAENKRAVDRIEKIDKSYCRLNKIKI